MKLYYHPASTTSRTILLFAAENGLALDMQVVDIFTGEHHKPAYEAINPNRLVPMLEDGDFRLTESSAILKYLADKTGSPLYPKDLQQRARVNERMDWINTQLGRDFCLRRRVSAGASPPQTPQRRGPCRHAAVGQGARAGLAEGAQRPHPRPWAQLPLR